MNLYSYVASNPINYIDPLGLEGAKNTALDDAIWGYKSYNTLNTYSTLILNVTTNYMDFNNKFNNQVNKIAFHLTIPRILTLRSNCVPCRLF